MLDRSEYLVIAFVYLSCPFICGLITKQFRGNYWEGIKLGFLLGPIGLIAIASLPGGISFYPEDDASIHHDENATPCPNQTSAEPDPPANSEPPANSDAASSEGESP